MAMDDAIYLDGLPLKQLLNSYLLLLYCTAIDTSSQSKDSGQGAKKAVFSGPVIPDDLTYIFTDASNLDR